MDQLVTVHVRANSGKTDVIHRLPYSEGLTVEVVNSTLRYLIPSVANQQICLVDAEGELLADRDHVVPNEYWLLASGAQGEGSDESGDEQAPVSTKEKRTEKVHRVRGHDYVAKHFHTVQTCAHCRNPMFGLGKQGYQCRGCGTILHKKCHKEYLIGCGDSPDIFPQCSRCKTRFSEEDNNDTACSYHVVQVGKMWCKNCMQPPYLGYGGCMVGRHIKKEQKKKAKMLRLLTSKSFSATEPVRNAICETADAAVSCDCEQHLANELLVKEYCLPVNQFFEYFCGQDPTKIAAIYKKLGARDLNIGEWVEEDGHQYRTITYILPLKNSVGPGESPCTERQYLRQKHNRRLRANVERVKVNVFEWAFSITVAVDIPEMPYGESYTTYVRYCFAARGRHTTYVNITSEQRFHATDASVWKDLFEKVVHTLIESKMRMDMISHANLLREMLDEEESAYMAKESIRREDVITIKDAASSAEWLTASHVIRMPSWVSWLLLFAFAFFFVSTWIMYIRIQEIDALMLKLGLQHVKPPD